MVKSIGFRWDTLPQMAESCAGYGTGNMKHAFESDNEKRTVTTLTGNIIWDWI